MILKDKNKLNLLLSDLTNIKLHFNRCNQKKHNQSREKELQRIAKLSMFKSVCTGD